MYNVYIIDDICESKWYDTGSRTKQSYQTARERHTLYIYIYASSSDAWLYVQAAWMQRGLKSHLGWSPAGLAPRWLWLCNAISRATKPLIMGLQLVQTSLHSVAFPVFSCTCTSHSNIEGLLSFPLFDAMHTSVPRLPADQLGFQDVNDSALHLPALFSTQML